MKNKIEIKLLNFYFNLMNLKNCKLVNIVWVERGILLMIIYIIMKKYDYLRDKKIIINDKKLRDFLKVVFPHLKFNNGDSNSKRNFYFNIRNSSEKQDIVIDYLSNYDKYINTKKIWLIPYYDMNDPLILYYYQSHKKLDAKNQKKIINQFSGCERGNYRNTNYAWDMIFENSIIS